MKVSQWEPSEHKALVETADLLTRVGDYLLFCGRWLEMVTLYQRALQLRKSTFGTTDSRTIEAMERLAHAIMKLGNYQKALELFKKSRKNRIKTLGLPETHADVVTSDMNIGVAQRKLGQLSLAETLLTKALALRIKAFGDDHPDSAQGMYEMAQLYRAQGVRDKQTELLKKSLKIQGLHLGLKDPRTMETKLRLGSHLDLLGDGANAKKHLKEVFDLQCRLFGIRHPRTLEAKLRHGTAEYSSKENVYQALQVSSEVVAASTDTLGQTHPLTLRARGMRARYLFLVGRYANAASIQRNVLKSYSTKLGRTHCLSLSTQVSLADTLSSQGKMRDSKELATPAHDALCAQFGKDDARTIAAAKLLGRLADVPEKA
jgi:tetratricopeptide (TPR) repeat protein